MTRGRRVGTAEWRLDDGTGRLLAHGTTPHISGVMPPLLRV
jgi:hypothetical protein